MFGEFLGESDNSINKNRVVIPAPFKAKILASVSKTVVITIGKTNECIAVFPMDMWKVLYEERLSSDDEEMKSRFDTMVKLASEQEIEGPGRIKINDRLLNIANIKNNVKIVGEGHYFSLWDPDKYEEFICQGVSSFKADSSNKDYNFKVRKVL